MKKNPILGETGSGRNIYATFDLKLCVDYSEQDYQDAADYFKALYVHEINNWRTQMAIKFPALIKDSYTPQYEDVCIVMSMQEREYYLSEINKDIISEIKDQQHLQLQVFEKERQILLTQLRSIRQLSWPYTYGVSNIRSNAEKALNKLKKLGYDTSNLTSVIKILQ